MFKTETIKGYNKLTGNDRKVFDKFLKDYYKGWEFPQEHEPISVKVKKGFLRVKFIDGSWLHVKLMEIGIKGGN